MKTLHWIYTAFAGLPLALASLAVLCWPERLDNTAILFLGTGCLGALGLTAWLAWLEYLMKRAYSEQVESLQSKLEDKKLEIAELRRQLKEAESKLQNNKPELPPVEKRLLDLAEKLRTKTTRETQKGEVTATTTDEVPEAVRSFIVERLKAIFSTDKNA